MKVAHDEDEALAGVKRKTLPATFALAFLLREALRSPLKKLKSKATVVERCLGLGAARYRLFLLELDLPDRDGLFRSERVA
jgi:hypothetical protein